jgi:transcriptional antiterminator RfaH
MDRGTGNVPHWFAVHAKARQEQVAVEHLERQGFETFLPLIRAARRRRGRWQSPLEALFPGYLFARIDPNIQDVSPIRSTRGCVGLVRHGGRLLPVPEPLVCELQSRHDGQAIDCTPLFKPGDTVTLVDGPFTGLTGIFEARSGLERVAILLDLMGRSNRVNVSINHLAPAR